METTDDILRDMREFADTESQSIGRDVLRRRILHFAGRIKKAHEFELAVEKAKAAGEGYAAGKQSVTDCNQYVTDCHGLNAAAKRETPAISEGRKRSKYERLHECFWDKRAVQCVIRQMLDERDDLSSIDSVSANRMDFFANQLIGAASDGKSVGNAAKMRNALECIDSIAKYLEAGTIRDVQHAYRNIQDRVRIALSAPPRNCDRFKTEDEAWDYYMNNGRVNNGNFCSTNYVKWLFAEAKGEKK